MITVYVLRGRKTKKRYVGITNNLSRRTREHQAGNSAAGKVIGQDVDVILTESYPDYATARRRERYLKSGAGREWMDSMFTGSRPASGG